jgi:transketolase
MSKTSAPDQLCIDTIRTLAIDAIQKANSGHPGLPLGAAPMAYALWQRHLRHDPTDPAWLDRDRFVLSAGHGSMLLYALLHLYGYDLSLDDLKSFRQWQSKTPGHPEFGLTPGVEATTGPLGQGTANAVGMAIAERLLARRFNRPEIEIVSHFTYALVSDGDVMEGVAAEAAALAGHLRLGKLIYLYDANDVTLDGPASLAFSEDVAKRYEACGWHVQQVADGDTDLQAIDDAITAAKQETDRPSLVIIKTTLGYGSPSKQGTSDAHGSPLGPEEVERTKEAFGFDPTEHFHVPEGAAARFAEASEQGRAAHRRWTDTWDRYRRAHPDLAGAIEQAIDGALPATWDEQLPAWQAGDALATRKASSIVLNAIAKAVPEVVGGDADLSVSTGTRLKDFDSFDGRSGAGRNLHFGVREHAMGSIANGMAYHRGVRPFAATFFVFSDYMRPAVRMAAMNHLPVIYIWTHDSIGLGEDGPTHQPVEHLMSLRAIPNLYVMRPADAVETREAWRVAMQRKDGPVAFVLTRQNVPVVKESVGGAAQGVARGAYVLVDPPEGEPEVILIATGSEVHVALGAHAVLAGQGVGARVVSMPCWELFSHQDPSYRDAVLPPAIRKRVSIEAGVGLGWERWVGSEGLTISVDRFGASAPGPKLFEEYGFTPEKVAGAVNAFIGR